MDRAATGSGRVDGFDYLVAAPEKVTPRTALVVAVHGSDRDAAGTLELMRGFGFEHDALILAPLFPVRPGADPDELGYKRLRDHGVAYDTAVVKMVAEVLGVFGLTDDRFGLYGFSGGGQFAHRFAIIYPECLWGVSVGAPGTATLLDPDLPYWAGIGGIEEEFGRPVDLTELRALPVHCIVGADDLDTSTITRQRGSSSWVEGAEVAGVTRVDRLHSLRDSFARAGVAAEFDLVPGVRHEGEKLAGPSRDFLAPALQARRGRA